MTSSCPPPLLLLTHWPTRHAEPRASFHSTSNTGQPDRTNMTGLRNNSILAMVVLLLTATWWHADRTRVLQGLLPCNDQRARGCLRETWELQESSRCSAGSGPSGCAGAGQRLPAKTNLFVFLATNVHKLRRSSRSAWAAEVAQSRRPCSRGCRAGESSTQGGLYNDVEQRLRHAAQRLSAWCSPPRA